MPDTAQTRIVTLQAIVSYMVARANDKDDRERASEAERKLLFQMAIDGKARFPRGAEGKGNDTAAESSC